MAELSPEIVEQVIEACKAGADEANEALSRALGIDGLTFAPGEPKAVTSEQVREEHTGPGLIVVLTVGSSAALFILPASAEFVPSWCADPDVTGKSKLTTLAQELGMILLPEEYMPDGFETVWVDDLAVAVERSGLAAEAAAIPFDLTVGDTQGVAQFVWPAGNPTGILQDGSEGDAPEVQEPSETPPQQETTTKAGAAPGDRPEAERTLPWEQRISLDSLPSYTRSLLRIKVPVVVTLAQKRQKLAEIMEIGPGSIIRFEKSCEEMLELGLDDRPVAVGEAVKVGDKFGLRVASLILPDERFVPIQPASSH